LIEINSSSCPKISFIYDIFGGGSDDKLGSSIFECEIEVDFLEMGVGKDAAHKICFVKLY
jgi:hypothetical protein